jgi:hypothetical protein
MWAWLETLTGRRRQDPSPPDGSLTTPMSDKIRAEQKRSDVMKRLAAIDIQIKAMSREQDHNGGSTAA